jgi:hypothetical protein
MKSTIAHSGAILAVVIVAMSLGMGGASAQQRPEEKTPHHAAAAPANVKLTPLNVKPGLWETTVGYTRAGELPVPPGMLARLTPEQRARLEERMKADSASRTTTETHRGCLTKKEVEEADFEIGHECTSTVLTSTSTHAKGNLSCEMEGTKYNGTLEVSVLDPEHVKGSSHGTATGNGHEMNMSSTFTSKWLGSDCHGVK